MTFSICVHEPYTVDEDDDVHHRFGVAVTTRLPGVGTLCPFASDHGAVATQSLVNVELGRRGIEYLDDGLAVEDALQSLLNADEGRAQRQLHGVDAEGTFTYSGEECKPWYGHRTAETGRATVAGNLLTGEAVIDATLDTYLEARPPTPAMETDGDGGADTDAAASTSEDDGVSTAEPPAADAADGVAPLAERLIDALAAGHAEGGDKREDLPVQSAALLVCTTEDRPIDPYYDDLRVDATETPIDDLRATYEQAVRGYEMTLDRYEEAYEEDDMDDVADAE